MHNFNFSLGQNLQLSFSMILLHPYDHNLGLEEGTVGKSLNLGNCLQLLVFVQISISSLTLRLLTNQKKKARVSFKTTLWSDRFQFSCTYI